MGVVVYCVDKVDSPRSGSKRAVRVATVISDWYIFLSRTVSVIHRQTQAELSSMLSSTRQTAQKLSVPLRSGSLRAYATQKRKPISSEREYEFSIGQTPGLFAAYFRSWNFFSSLSDVHCVVRELEKQYGPINEFKVERVCISRQCYNLS
jgi:hypothetical protein